MTHAVGQCGASSATFNAISSGEVTRYQTSDGVPRVPPGVDGILWSNKMGGCTCLNLSKLSVITIKTRLHSILLSPEVLKNF